MTWRNGRRMDGLRSFDAALFGGADGDWYAPQGGVVALLDGCEEGIHVDVDDFAEFHRLLLQSK